MQILPRILLVWLLGAMAACTEAPVPPLQVGTNVWPGYEPLYLARDLGYFDEQQVRLLEYSSASQVIRSYRNGSIDAAALTLDEVLLLAQDGFEPRVVLVMDISDGGDAIIGQPGIKSMAELRGKRIGFESTALGAYVLARALEKAGMKGEEVQMVPVEVDEHERAFKDGSIDAVVTFDPVRSRLLAAGGVALFDSSQIPGEVVDVLVVRRRVLQERAADVDELLADWYKAIAYLERTPEDAAKRMAHRLSLSPSEVLQSYDGLQLPGPDVNARLLGTAGGAPALKDVAWRLTNVMRANQLLSKPVDVAQLFDRGQSR